MRELAIYANGSLSRLSRAVGGGTQLRGITTIRPRPGLRGLIDRVSLRVLARLRGLERVEEPRPGGWVGHEGEGRLFIGWNGWSLWLFGRHETGLLPGQATHAMIEEGPYRLSRNPLYVGLLALYLGLELLVPTFWGLVLFPAAALLVLWGAIRPEERYLHERFGAPYDDYARRVRRWL